MRKNLLIMTALIIIGALSLFSIQSFVEGIYNRTDCEQFNIDNIEVRTGIDIPKILSVDCNFDAATRTKTSTFMLDYTIMDVEDYIRKNEFVLENEQYVNSGERADTKWKAVLDKETGALKISVVYK